MPKTVKPPFGAPRGVNNTYSNATLQELRIWVAKDPRCQYFATLKIQQLKEEHQRLLQQRLKAKKPKRPFGGRQKAHNKSLPHRRR